MDVGRGPANGKRRGTAVKSKLLGTCLACAAGALIHAAYAAEGVQGTEGIVAPEGTGTGATSFVEDGKQVFLPAFFNRFAPQTAADMVRNVPGFQIRSADNRRGLGQGGANILIDGARVSGKTTDPLAVLQRTSHEAVNRIEIVDGASLGISGLSGPVANVLLDREKRTGNIEWRPQFRKGLASRLTSGSASLTGMMSDWSYTVGLENDSFRKGLWGEELVTGPSQDLIERRYEQVQNYGENPRATLSLGHTDAKGREANINASLTLFQFDFSERSDRDPVDPAEINNLRLVQSSEDEWNTELSGDYSFDAFGGRTKFIGFYYFEHSPFVTSSRTDDDNGFVSAARFERTVDEGERIGRIEQLWSFQDNRSFELGAEVAFNFNDAESTRFEVAEDGTATPVDLTGANTRIEELRGEVSGTYNFSIGKRLDVQASLGYEYSKLSQTGENANERTFTRPKGFLSATYGLTPTLEWRARLDRRVGQLPFGAFASAVSLVDNVERQGNAELVPEQSWYYETALEKTFADESQMTLSLSFEDIEDKVQIVPVGTGEGAGNVPSARRWRADLSGTQMLERIGIEGGQVKWKLTLRDSEIADPFTGEVRQLNGERKSFYEIRYRHDIPNTDFAYGLNVEDFDNARIFRSSQVGLFSNSDPVWSAFVQHKDLKGLNVKAYVYNITNSSEDFTRDLFDGRRPDGAFLRREDRAFQYDPVVGFDISKTF